MSNSLWLHGLKSAKLLCPWDSPGKNIGVGYHFLLHGTFLTQGLNPNLLCLLPWQVGSLPLCHMGSQALLGNILSLTFSNSLVYSLHSNLVTLTPHHLPRTSQMILLEDLKTPSYLLHLSLFMCIAHVCPHIYTVASISSITFSKLKVTKLMFEFHFWASPPPQTNIH